MNQEFVFRQQELNDWLSRNRGYSLRTFNQLFLPHWPFNENWLYGLVCLESGFDPRARNKQAVGLFQAIPRFFSTATDSARLTDHVQTLNQIVDRIPRDTNSFTSLYLHHFLPAVRDSHVKYPNARFVEYPVQEGRYNTYNLQLGAIIETAPFLAIPVIDTFVPFFRLLSFSKSSGVGIEFAQVQKSLSIATEVGYAIPAEFTLVTQTADSELDSTEADLVSRFSDSQGTLNKSGTLYSSEAAPVELRSNASKVILAESLLTTFTESGAEIFQENGFVLGAPDRGNVESLAVRSLMAPSIRAGNTDFTLHAPFNAPATLESKTVMLDAWDRSLSLGLSFLSDEASLLEFAPVRDAQIVYETTLRAEYHDAIVRCVVKKLDIESQMPPELKFALYTFLTSDRTFSQSGYVPPDLFRAVLAANLAIMPPEILCKKALMHGLYTSLDPSLESVLLHDGYLFPLSLPVVPVSQNWTGISRTYLDRQVTALLRDRDVSLRLNFLSDYGVRNFEPNVSRLGRYYAEMAFEALKAARKDIGSAKRPGEASLKSTYTNLINFLSQVYNF